LLVLSLDSSNNFYAQKNPSSNEQVPNPNDVFLFFSKVDINLLSKPIRNFVLTIIVTGNRLGSPDFIYRIGIDMRKINAPIALPFVTLFLAFCLLVAIARPIIAQPNLNSVTVTRLMDRPIIGPELHPSIGENIQGPTLVKVPEWVTEKLGNYYLYFADHKGSYIRLAYADTLTGPWQIHVAGSLQIGESFFPSEPPPISEERLAEMVRQRTASGAVFSHDLATELTSPHIASPDIHIDEANEQFIMYYHGLAGPGRQVTRVATSTNGIDFTAQAQELGRTYMRIFAHEGMTYSMSMPGQFYRSRDGFTDFETGPRLFNSNMRHSALLIRDNHLFVFWTQVGDIPEHIKLSIIELTPDWMQWQTSDWVEVLRPEYDWEGATAPLEPSVRSTAYGRVNQLRDPAIFEEDGEVYLLYTVGGEAGIAIAKLEF